jgi:predicted nucleic acid-binding protein
VIYLLDTSGLVRLLRDPSLREAWYDALDAEAIGSCYPQRTEFLYTARSASEYNEITEMFTDLYPDVPVPKNAGRWIASVQRQMAQAGQHRSASAIDLMIAATAAHHGLTVLHDDADYRTVARHAPDFSEHNVYHLSRPEPAGQRNECDGSGVLWFTRWAGPGSSCRGSRRGCGGGRGPGPAR